MELKDKIVLVAGATGGIGSELCKLLAQKGAFLVAIARFKDKLDQLSKELPGNSHSFYTCDFTKIDEIENSVKKISADINRLDVLINAAGIGIYKEIEDVEIKEWKDSFAINVTAPFFLTKMLLPLLRKSEKSVVINIGSGMGKIPTPGRSVYCATKYALRGMSLSLSEEFEGSNVHIVHIALGSTLTEFGPMTLKEKEEENLKGKSYFTPSWVAKKFIEIIEKEEFEEEIEIYPSDYKEVR